MAGAIQFWGLGSGMSNIGDVVDAMLLTDKYKLQGYQDKQKILNVKKDAWADIKKSLDSMNDSIKKLSGNKRDNFMSASTNIEGVLNVVTDGSSASGEYTVTIEQLAQKHTVAGQKRVDNVKAPLGLSGDFSINGYTVSVSEKDSLANVMSKINALKDEEGKSSGIKAHIIDGVLFVESTKPGIDNSLKIEDGAGVLSNLGLVKEDGSLNTTKEPKNSLITINGVQVERSSNTIDDAIDGVTLSLTKVSADPVEVSVSNDKESVKTLVTDFTKTINELFDKMKKHTSYDVAANTKGALNGDSSVDMMKRRISGLFQKSYGDSELSRLFEIGITLDRSGKLNVDEKKLEAALESNIDSVVNMFTAGLENPKADPNDPSNGLFVSLKGVLDSFTGGKDNLFASKTQSLDSQIKTYDRLIERQQSYIDKRKKMLESEFRAMEQVMNSLNGQSGFLMNSANLGSN